MTTSRLMEDNRKVILLRAAYDLLKRAKESPVVEETCSICVRYDDADCDGNCLMEDIAHEINLEDETPPIPLG